MKNDQQGDHSHTEKLPHNGGDQLHIQRPHQQPGHIKRKNSGKDINRYRPLHQTINLIKNKSNDQNIQYIEKAELDL